LNLLLTDQSIAVIAGRKEEQIGQDVSKKTFLSPNKNRREGGFWLDDI